MSRGPRPSGQQQAERVGCDAARVVAEGGRVRNRPDGRREARGGQPVTIRDVAHAASVSVSTVSHVLSGKRPTSVATRERVVAAVQRLGYRPNAVAQSLVRRRSFALGLVIPDITNPYFPALAHGVDDYVRRRGYTVVLANSGYSVAREIDSLDLLRARQLAGAIYCLGEESSPTAAALRRAAQDGLPVVLVHNRVPGIPTVCADNFLGGQLAGRHLVALGHTRLGLVSARPLDVAVLDRERGFRQSVERWSGGGASEVAIAYGDHQIAGGRAAMRELLARQPDLSAVFVVNDLMALGALEAARAAGRRVPDDLSIVGFDDIPFAAMANPPLTTIAQPIRLLGERAAELLLRLIEGSYPTAERAEGQPPSLVLPVELVVRESTRRVAGWRADETRT